MPPKNSTFAPSLVKSLGTRLPLTHGIHICCTCKNNKQLTLYQQVIRFVIMVSHNLKFLIYTCFSTSLISSYSQ